MRILSVTRNKSFAASLGKYKLYIEDNENNELTINGVPCRKLGTIKNGETVTFEITENAVKVFAIADKMSKEYCNDCYQIEAGNAPVFLSGSGTYNPVMGNAFVFDNNNTPTLAVKKKKKPIAIVLFVAALIVAFIGMILINSIELDQTFTYQNMQITLTDDFNEYNMTGYSAAYSSNDYAVLVLEEKKTLFDNGDSMTLDAYVAVVLDVNALDLEIQHNDGLTYYVKPSTLTDGDTIYWYAFAYDSGDAFWLIQIMTDSTSNESEVLGFAKTVKFTK